MPKIIIKLLCLVACLGLTPPVSAEWCRRGPEGAVIHLADGHLLLQPYSDSIVRVAFSRDPEFFKRPFLTLLERPASFNHWRWEEKDGLGFLRTASLSVSVDPKTGAVRFLDVTGREILAEKPGGRVLSKTSAPGNHAFRVGQKWKRPADTSLHGLGQMQHGFMDLTGLDLDLWQHNTQSFVPFLVSSGGWGILWDNASFTQFGDTRPFLPISPSCLVDKNGRAGGLTYDPGNGPSRRSAVLTYEMRDKRTNGPPSTRRWEGYIQPPVTGTYQIRCRSNGGLKVVIDGRTVMEHWRQAWLTDGEEALIAFHKNRRAAIRVEWGGEQATSFRLEWKGPPREDCVSLTSEAGEGTDYTFVHAPDLDRVVAGYRFLTGPSPLAPAWAFGLWQSRNRYRTADESLQVVKRFRRLKLPLDNIVQDYQYWKPESWGSHLFDPERFPDPASWVKSLHREHTRLMVSVWGKFYPGTGHYEDLAEKGYLYARQVKERPIDWLKYEFAFYDAFNPGARKMFFDQVAKSLLPLGVDAWWMDATEPDLVPSPPDRKKVLEQMDPTFLGPSVSVAQSYPLANSRGVFEGLTAAEPDKRPFILTRCAYAGIQQYGSAVWSGDISSTWTAFSKQIPAGLNLSLSGVPYWTTDSGGYWPPPKFASRDPSAEDVEEWRELNVRWFQFATFCPLTRLHGDMLPREPWEFGGEDSPAYRAIAKMDRLRYRMLPYVYSLAHQVTVQGGVFMRPLVMDFPHDATARAVTDQYLFGKNLLVAPITRHGARTRQVYLPAGTHWWDFRTGQLVPGGPIESRAPYDEIPLYVRAGSILPFGPDLQYTLEKPWDPILFYVYPGADGAFVLYEDDGETTAYRGGAFSEIPITWNEAERRLTIGARRGSFKGMMKKRTFGVVWAGPERATGYDFGRKPDIKFSYNGREISIQRPLNARMKLQLSECI